MSARGGSQDEQEQFKRAVIFGVKAAAAVLSPAALFIVLAFVVIGYFIPVVGFGEQVIHVPSNSIVEPAKTLWDWMQLLLIPVVLALAGLWYTGHLGRIQRESAERQHQQDFEIAEERTRQAVLENYFDKIEALLLTGQLSTASESKASVSTIAPGATVARARTLTALRQLDAIRKGHLMMFLVEAGLVSGDQPIIDLSHADLRGVDLRHLSLNGAHLEQADLTGARLAYTNLRGAKLYSAKLNNVDLSGAKLEGAILRSAELKEADLGGAYLTGAKLSLADLSNARLSWANFEDTDLQHVTVKGATYNANTKWPRGYSPSVWGAVYKP